MKKLFYLLVPILLLAGCDNEVSLFDNFEEDVIINAPINLDSSRQRVSIYKSFPSKTDIKNLDDYFINNAQIELTDGKYYYYFLKSAKHNYYYCDNFVNRNKEKLAIRITLPSGGTINSEIKPPTNFKFYLVKYTEVLPRALDKPAEYSWIYRADRDESYGFLPLLGIYYTLKSENDSLTHKIYVPDKIINKFGNDYFIYQNISLVDFRFYSQENINKTFEFLAKKYQTAEDVKIIEAKFEIIVLDKNLADYYSTLNRQGKGFTLMLEKMEFTNVEPGLGVFGAFFKYTKKVRFTFNYLDSFGFRYKTN